ncbi:MAG: hypothetical protein ABSF91_06990 [Bacteroidota bacterium]|jgi:hypothetical protein
MESFILLIVFVLIVFVTEPVLYILGVRWYYEHGIPVFEKRYFFHFQEPERLDCKTIQGAIEPSMFASLVAKEVNPQHFAIHEKPFEFFKIHYGPVIRGLLKYDPIKREIVLVGFLNYVPTFYFGLCLLISIILLFSNGNGGVSFLSFLFACSFLIPYFVQTQRLQAIPAALGATLVSSSHE